MSSTITVEASTRISSTKIYLVHVPINSDEISYNRNLLCVHTNPRTRAHIHTHTHTFQRLQPVQRQKHIEMLITIASMLRIFPSLRSESIEIDKVSTSSKCCAHLNNNNNNNNIRNNLKHNRGTQSVSMKFASTSQRDWLPPLVLSKRKRQTSHSHENRKTCAQDMLQPDERFVFIPRGDDWDEVIRVVRITAKCIRRCCWIYECLCVCVCFFVVPLFRSLLRGKGNVRMAIRYDSTFITVGPLYGASRRQTLKSCMPTA